MDENLIWWSGQLFVSILDFISMYLITHALMKKYIIVEKKHVLFCVVFAVLTGLCFDFFDGWTAQVITHLLMILLIKGIFKRASGSDMIIIYLVWIVTLGIFQTIFLSVVGLFSLERTASFLIAQTFTTVAVFAACKLCKWYRLFHAIRANLVLKLILFIIFLVTLSAALILNFQYDLMSIFFSLVAIVFTGVALSPIFVQVYQKAVGIILPEQLKNNLFMTAVDMLEDDPSAHYQIYAELAKQYGVDIAHFPKTKKELEEQEAHMDAMNEKIEQFIQDKIANSEKILEADMDITYYEANKNVNFECMKEWLDILLDYALKTATNQPICVRLFSKNDAFNLEIGGQRGIDNWQAVEEIFKQGNSSNCDGDSTRLHALYSKVVELGGKLIVRPCYMPEYECHYLQISIKIEKEDDIN